MITRRARGLVHVVPRGSLRASRRQPLPRGWHAALGTESGVSQEHIRLFDSIEQGQEMLALSHRNVMAELIKEVRRRRSRFLVSTPAPTGSFDQAHGIDPHALFKQLQRKPHEPPVTTDVAESLMLAMEREFQGLRSPVIDLSLPQTESSPDPRIVVVGDTHGQLLDVLYIFETQGLPSPDVVYLFNGDIVDRGRYAVEIWLLLAAFKLQYPNSIHILRGNHENEQMITRPFKMGGGFAEECLSKYSRPLLSTFQRVFKLLPLFAVIEEEVFVVHGGLFRRQGVTLDRLRSLPESAWKRNYPNPLTNEQLARGEKWTQDEEILFDAQWADPHYGSGSRPSSRGRVAVTFGEDVTHRFLDEAGLSVCIRSHRVPQSGRGFEFEHGSRLLTLFSASRYGGVLHNRGACAVIRSKINEHAGGSSSSAAPAPPLRRVRLSVIEHDMDQRKDSPKDAADLSAATAVQVRHFVEQHAREHEANVEQHALGLICAEREELWRRCRQHDAQGTGIVPYSVLCDTLGDVCGDIGWPELLQRTAPDVGAKVAYGEFLASPRVQWFHFGAAQVEAVAQAAAQAEIQLCGLAALFAHRHPNDVVTPELARNALKSLLPSLRERQTQQLATALFGNAPTDLSSVLHTLALFADPPELKEAWMQPALERLASLIKQHHGPEPLHNAVERFFKAVDRDRSDLLTPDEFVKGFQSIGAYNNSGDSEVPLLHTGRLCKLFAAIDKNQSGTISFLELLLALDERPATRPKLPSFPAMEGEVPALLMVHKVALLRICRALDPGDNGRVSVDNFVEVVAALAEVIGRPLSFAARAALEEELDGEDVAYMDALQSFHVYADSWPWHLRSLGE
mmetsp:Transcript_103336/g.267256  ORF Transcript_103336/g.267256 Transcript_103336/m.267256 type:complete len:851 (+) Transcript_103336:57-2609(+)